MSYSKIKAIQHNETKEIISEKFLAEIYYNAQFSLINEIQEDFISLSIPDEIDYFENKRKIIEYYKYQLRKDSFNYKK